MAAPVVTPPEITRYAQSSNKAILQARKSAVPEKTQKDTTWCVHQWDNWARWKNSLVSVGQFPAIPSITSLSREALAANLETFVLEVRNKNGAEYSAETLYRIVCGLMRHLRESGAQHRLLQK